MKVRATFLTTTAPFLAVAVAPSGAFAKDLPLVKPAPPTQAYAAVGPVYSWSGFYFGASLGAARVRTRADDTDAVNASIGAICAFLDRGKCSAQPFSGSGGSVTYSDTGMIFGLTTGWNQQTGSWVWGFEADTNYALVNAQKVVTGTDVTKGSTVTSTRTFKTELGWLSTWRGRLGLDVDGTLFYVTGGAALGEVTNSWLYSGKGKGSGEKRRWKFGWVAGGGAERMMWNGVSAKLEFLWVDLGKNDVPVNLNSNVPKGATSGTVTFKNQVGIIRFGINIHR